MSYKNQFQLILFLSVLGLYGCGIFKVNSYKNEKHNASNTTKITRTETNFTNKVGNTKAFEHEPNANSRRPFIGIALSGGGSRSANFSAGILHYLERLKTFKVTDPNLFVNLDVNKHVAAISSVSGGGVTAAYYSLFNTCDRTKSNFAACKDEWWKVFKKKLRTNFTAHTIFRLLLPHHFLRYWWTDYDRSDILAGVLDDKLFEGKTFSHLEKPNVPKLYINASNLSGQVKNENNHYKRRVLPFTFTEDNFKNFLDSELSTYPIAYAVTASAAFPALLHNVTLRNFTFNSEERYAHFFDGGPSDNLGIITLLETYSKNKKEFNFFNDCFVFVVDASNSGLYDWDVTGKKNVKDDGVTAEDKKLEAKINFLKEKIRGKNNINADPRTFKSDTRGVTDFFIDRNVIDASDRMLMNIRIRNLLQLGLDVRKTFKQPWGNRNLRNIYAGEKEDGIDCKSWHFSFNRLLGLMLEENNVKEKEKLYKLWRTVTTTGTDFKIESRDNTFKDESPCEGEDDAESVQCAFFEAARYLVEDAVKVLGKKYSDNPHELNWTNEDTLMWFDKNFNEKWNPNLVK
jgi:predicted acylesterase/phospholipase RssA